MVDRIDRIEMDCLESRNKSLYLVSSMARKGAIDFLTRLEYDFYPPDTDKNDDFNVFHTTYNQILHYIIEIPSRDFETARQLALTYNFKCVPGLPHQPGGDDFSIHGHACFTLEFI